MSMPNPTDILAVTAPVEPIEFTTKRYKCPFCNRGHSARKAAAQHIGRCWLNPAKRSCKTCLNFEPYVPSFDEPEHCRRGVDLRSRPCPICAGGSGWWETCDHCKATGKDPDTGTKPITDCELWEVSHG